MVRLFTVSLFTPCGCLRMVPESARNGALSVAVSELLPVLPGLEEPPALASLDLSMASLYGAAHCTGSEEGFVAERAAAPPAFCRREGKDMARRGLAAKNHHDWTFDNYALERLLLGKWLASPLRGGDRANVVVVPSLPFHFFVRYGFSWPVFYAMEPEDHDVYWRVVRQRYPEGEDAPLLLLHLPIAFHCHEAMEILKSLARQPQAFGSRLVITTLEANLFSWARRELPWRPRDLGMALAGEKEGPVLVSLPYPTSILEAANFSESSGAYLAERERPIAVSLQASGKEGAWIRDEALALVGRRGLLCAGAERPHCGLAREPNMWEVAVNSQFCLEPAGDTLTRASFYVAVLSGCMPVIFDGGHEDFEEGERTQWAWRALGDDAPVFPFMNYTDFAVVLKAADVRRSREGVLEALAEMPRREPQRFAALRRNLAKAAPLMRYSSENCEGECQDAFTAFQAVLQRLLPAA